ncbi:MAG: MotA/TolQ/ExbB proton channel family protein [Desulfobacteraceae bacterium]|nr:MotA/TolQ/ExbB proton channel family protein [Desulfobacteraceae bacterium]
MKREWAPMDFATIIGVVSGISLIVASILMGSGLGLFVNLPSIMIVGGGTLAATLIAYPLKEFLSVIGLFLRVFMFKQSKPEALIQQLVEIANKARKGGLLSIEGAIAEIKEPFLAKSLQMTVDGVNTTDIAGIMQKEISLLQKQHKVGWEMFATMGAYSPAFGMVGTLIGLVQMLATLDDPSTIGPKMAVAMITTFYGALVSNLFFLPMSAKLKRRSAEETLNLNLLREGVLSIREGEHPRLMEDKLTVYLSGSKKNGEKGPEKTKELAKNEG